MEESRSAPDGPAVRTTPAPARRPPAAPRPTASARDWRPVPLTDSGLFRGYRAYLPPAQRTTAGRAPAAR